jgi:hypothetical protein
MTTPTPITDAVKAALIYVRNDYEDAEQYDLASQKMQSEILNKDRGRGAPQLAAAARILADEVERLRAEQSTIALSDCCSAPAVVAGKPGSTQWYVCPQCCQPCDVFYQDTNTQPQ